MNEIIKILKERGWCIGVMESCTGGAIANAITNIPGASDVFEEGLVTYSEKSKIKYGVDPRIIEKFGVYSKETAEEMAKKIKGDIGVGVTGQLPGKIFLAIRINKKIINKIIEVDRERREEMKQVIVEEVIHMVLKSL